MSLFAEDRACAQSANAGLLSRSCSHSHPFANKVKRHIRREKQWNHSPCTPHPRWLRCSIHRRGSTRRRINVSGVPWFYFAETLLTAGLQPLGSYRRLALQTHVLVRKRTSFPAPAADTFSRLFLLFRGKPLEHRKIRRKLPHRTKISMRK